jgi:hypothetical protein
MTRDINREYFEWLCEIVSDSKPKKNCSYGKLLEYLHQTEFVFILPMDENRCVDGMNLRYRFGYEYNIGDPVIASCLDNDPCSILEMMVALSFYVEEHIMVDPEYGLMSGRWFWMMINNLGLSEMTDDNFDYELVNRNIWHFLNRDYDRDGKGGLIYMPNSRYDFRTMDIWYQMMRYLAEYRRNRME